MFKEKQIKLKLKGFRSHVFYWSTSPSFWLLKYFSSYLMSVSFLLQLFKSDMFRAREILSRTSTHIYIIFYRRGFIAGAYSFVCYSLRESRHKSNERYIHYSVSLLILNIYFFLNKIPFKCSFVFVNTFLWKIMHLLSIN